MVSDSHAHLDMADFDPDRAEVIARARAVGLKWIIGVAMLGSGEEEALALASQHPFIRAVVGCHPHDAGGFDQKSLERLAALARRPEVLGIGEIGLDFYRDYSPRPAQEKALAEQLGLARELGLPVVIHSRQAHGRVMEIIRAAGASRGVFHCFSGDLQAARQVLDLGFYLSIPGVITFTQAKKIREVAAFAPLDRLLLETDCPYLAPEPFRGRRNEPAHVVLVARKLAEVKGLSEAEVAAATTANLERLFGLEAG